MIGILFAAVLALPQLPIPPGCEAVILPGASSPEGALKLAALDLGDGGVRLPAARRSSARRTPPADRFATVTAGTHRTHGGVLIRAQREGVKLDFPSGRELLCSPDGRIHLRSGEHTLPFFRGIQLRLADGAVVTVRRGAHARLPLDSVEVEEAGRTRRLWAGRKRVRNASRVGVFLGATVLALGDGGTLYVADAAGPLVALKRALCPKAEQGRTPERRLLVLADILARSLQLLPEHAPAKSVQFPQVAEAAVKFARLAPLFAKPVPRPPSAVGQLWFPLPQDYRLKVEATASGMLVVGLFGAAGAVPGVEWTLAGRNQVHFVRPTGGLRGGPRYFMRGIDLKEICGDPFAGRSNHAQRAAVHDLVLGLGGRRPKVLEIKRRRAN